MKKRSLAEYRTRGDAVLERLASQNTSKTLAPHIKAFATEHQNHLDAVEKAQAADALRQAALADVGEADDALDRLVLALADRLVGAGLGDRRNPFAKYSKHPPRALANLAYARQVQEVRALCQSIAKAKPQSDVTAALKQCLTAAGEVETRLRRLAGPQAACAKAFAVRDASIVTWLKAHDRLKHRARVEFEDEPATFTAVFAPPNQLVRPRTRRRKLKGTPTPADPA